MNHQNYPSPGAPSTAVGTAFAHGAFALLMLLRAMYQGTAERVDVHNDTTLQHAPQAYLPKARISAALLSSDVEAMAFPTVEASAPAHRHRISRMCTMIPVRVSEVRE